MLRIRRSAPPPVIETGVALEEHGRAAAGVARFKRRKLNLKAKCESSSSYFSFKSLVPGAFNAGFIGSICTALPGADLEKCHSFSPQRQHVV